MRRRWFAGGRRRLKVAFALGTIVLAGEAIARGGDHRPRCMPENAVQPPGASFEGEPYVGRRQKVEILREALHATCQDERITPLLSAVQASRRLAERMIVGVREGLPPALIGRGRDGPFPCELGGGYGEPPLPARLTLLTDSEPALQALLALIASARARIDLMIYGWQDDPTGREVAAALAGRARDGVRVRLLVDRTGFLIHNPAAARGEWTFLDALAAVPNVTVIEPPGAFFRFDHRKLAVVDGRVAWTGGMILTEAARRRWHNFAFLAEGPIVASYARLFDARWAEQGGAPEPPLAMPEAPGPPNAEVRLIRTDLGERSLKDTVYHAVDHARRSIYLENPYFSDEILAKKLVAARERGVDVRAVLTLRGNIRTMNRFEALTADRLLRGGVRVYLYPKMTHVKALSADGTWAYLGTGNFDELSLRNNREVGLAVASPAVVARLDDALFAADMAASQELTAPLPRPEGWPILELMALWY